MGVRRFVGGLGLWCSLVALPGPAAAQHGARELTVEQITDTALNGQRLTGLRWHP